MTSRINCAKYVHLRSRKGTHEENTAPAFQRESRRLRRDRWSELCQVRTAAPALHWKPDVGSMVPWAIRLPASQSGVSLEPGDSSPRHSVSLRPRDARATDRELQGRRDRVVLDRPGDPA